MRASSQAMHVTCRPFLFPCLAAASMGFITAILSSCVLEETLPALRKQPKQGEPLGVHPSALRPLWTMPAGVSDCLLSCVGLPLYYSI